MTRPSSSTPRRPLSGLAAFVAIIVVFIVGVWVGGHPRQTGLDRIQPEAVRNALLADDRRAVGSQVLAILENDYYKPLDPEVIKKAQDASASGVVDALGDPYSQYLNPDDYADYLAASEGTYVGVGIEWTPEGDSGRVVRVTAGGPADTAGIRPKDRIVAVDGMPVRESDKYAAMGTVKGTKGTEVTLRVVRGSEKPRDYTMERDEIRERVVDASTRTINGRTVGYVRLERFTPGAAEAVRSAVDGFVAKDVAGVVLDLRGNPGGLVDESVDVVGVFLPKDSEVARTRGRDGDSEELRTDDSPALDAKIPLVILMDRNSASASEIVAGALRDAGRARLVGDRTFGKALIQTTRTLPDGGALKFTTATYLTPKGFDLGTRGLPPDVRITDDPETEVDEALRRGLTLAARP